MREAADLWYAGDAHVYGGDIQAALAPDDGLPLCVASAKPGSVHDITAAPTRAHASAYAIPTAAGERGHGDLALARTRWSGSLQAGRDLGIKQLHAQRRAPHCAAWANAVSSC
jgi:hypothetical protein